MGAACMYEVTMAMCVWESFTRACHGIRLLLRNANQHDSAWHQETNHHHHHHVTH
jgi:hypothetical protein